MKAFFKEGKRTEKKLWKFHQFIHVETGARNAAIIDFANGNIYQVKKDIIDSFKKEKYESVSNFLDAAIRENLVIYVNEKKWIPYISFEKIDDFEIFDMAFDIEIENMANLDLIREKFENFKVNKVFFLGGEKYEEIFSLSMKEKLTLSPDSCRSLYEEIPNFTNINMAAYEFNINYNTCWGKKLVVTKDNSVKPCFFSDIIVGNLEQDNIVNITAVPTFKFENYISYLFSLSYERKLA